MISKSSKIILWINGYYLPLKKKTVNLYVTMQYKFKSALLSSKGIIHDFTLIGYTRSRLGISFISTKLQQHNTSTRQKSKRLKSPLSFHSWKRSLEGKHIYRFWIMLLYMRPTKIQNCTSFFFKN